MTLYVYKNNPSEGGTNYYTKIAIQAERVNENIGNAVMVTPIPKGKSGQSPDFNATTMLVDLKRITQKVTVQGYLTNQSAIINELDFSTFTSITATEAKNYMKKYILNGRGDAGLYWRGAAEDYTITNPTIADIDDRVFFGTINAIKFGDEILRLDLTQSEYEAIKGAYVGTYPGDVKRYRVAFDLVVGEKR